MKNWLSRHKTEVIIFSVAFGIRFLYALGVQYFFGSSGFTAYSDSQAFYLRNALNLISQHTFSLNTYAPFMPDMYRPPLYVLLTAFFLWSGAPLFFLIMLQNILAGFVAVLTYRLGILVFSSFKIGLGAALLVSLEPLSVYWNNLLMSDSLFTFLFVWAAYLFYRRQYCWFAALMGLAALTRTINVYFFLIFMAILLWQFFEKKQKVSWKVFLLSFLIFASVVFPWSLRNYLSLGTWQLSVAAWYNLGGVFVSQFADAHHIANLPELIVPADYPNPQYFRYDPANTDLYKARFMTVLREHPWAYFKFNLGFAFRYFYRNYYDYLVGSVIAAKLPSFWSAFLAPWLFKAGEVLRAAWVFIYILFLSGLAIRRHRLNWFLWAVLLAGNALSLGSLGLLGADGSRYIMPFMPFTFLLAGAGLSFWISKIKQLKISNART